MKIKEKKALHMCLTCRHYEPYHCALKDEYIGYLFCDEPTNCKSWRLHDDYKKKEKEKLDDAN